MLNIRKILTVATPAVIALGLGLYPANTADAGPPPTRGYQLQQSLSGRSTSPSVSPSTTVRSPVIAGPTYARTYTYPSYATPQYARGPVIVPPVTVPTAPAVTGDATKQPTSGPVIVWYEYVPSLGGWVEFRGTLVSGPPSAR
jgi:hypothetical protein